MGTQLYSKKGHKSHATHYYEILQEKKKKSKQLTLYSFLISSEVFISKIKSNLILIFSIICVIFYIPESLN